MVGDKAGMWMTVCGGNLPEEYNLAKFKNEEVLTFGAMARAAITDLETVNKADIGN